MLCQVSSTSNGNSFFDKLFNFDIEYEKENTLLEKLKQIKNSYGFLEQRSINEQIKTCLIEGGNFMIISYNIVPKKRNTIHENVKKPITKVLFDTRQMKEDSRNLKELNRLSFENSEQISMLELLEKTGTILSSKKEKQLEEFLKIKKDQGEFNEDLCLALFKKMVPEKFDNLFTISETTEDKETVLMFSKNIRKSIQSRKISHQLLDLFYELRDKISAKINYFIEIEKIYKKDNDNSKAFKDKNLQNFTRLVSEMNKEHTEAILLAVLRKGKESVIYYQLLNVIKDNHIQEDDSIEFSMISRYDSCSRCEFTLAEIRELLDKIASENSSMQIFPSFISINAYDKIREKDNEKFFLRNDGITQHPVEIGINSKKILRQYESLQILFGNSGIFSYVVQSGEKGCLVQLKEMACLPN